MSNLQSSYDGDSLNLRLEQYEHMYLYNIHTLQVSVKLANLALDWSLV